VWCVVLLKRHSSIVRVPGRYVLTSIELSLPPPHYFRGGAGGKLHCPRPMPGDILLTISMGRSPPGHCVVSYAANA
jgi:hypothetical protein